ncbi:MAG: adenylosuccinate synthetase [Armatimonadetes bacterium]|nr:adenylosuccinate synthetase [Armatimonadota bacterium]
MDPRLEPFAARTGNRSHTVVVGLQFGDEGKGQIVDLMAARHDVVVRFNGGANAGHTVRLPDGAGGETRIATHLLPSGVLTPDRLNVVAHGVVVDPEQLLSEIDALAEHGIELGASLCVSERAMLVAPWHKRADALLEKAIVAAGGLSLGTTGRGIGPAYADRAYRVSALRLGDLVAPDLESHLRSVLDLHNTILAALAARVGEPFEPFDAAEWAPRLAHWGERLRPHLTDTVALLHEADAKGLRILFEGANAALLDVDLGTWPFVTSSHTTALGVPSGAGVPCAWVNRVIGVAKAYTSRVGEGPFETELSGELADNLRQRGGEFGTTTGRPRRIGWLDLVSVGTMARTVGVTELAITGLGPLAGLPQVCCRVPGQAELAEFAGWPDGLDAFAAYDELPAPLQAYLATIEQHAAPVRWICLGRRRDQVLRR